MIDIVRDNLILLNNLASFLTVILCFTLTVQNRFGNEPLAIAISACYAALGILVTLNAMARNVPEITHVLPFTIIISRFVFVALLGLMAVRLHYLYDQSQN